MFQVFLDLCSAPYNTLFHLTNALQDLKKPGTCTVNGFFGIEEAVKVIKDCEERYNKEIDPKLVN